MRPAVTSIVVWISSQFSTLVGFVATFYIASYLGPEILGAYSITVGMLFWLHMPSSAIDSAITKRVSEGVDRGEILSAGILTNIALAIFAATGVLLISETVNSYVGHNVSTEIAVLVLCWFAANAMSALLNGQKKVAYASIVWTSGRVVRTGFQIGLTFLFGFGVSGLIWGHSISFIAATAFALMVNSVKPALPTWENFKRLFEYAKYSWLGQISGKAFNWLDTIILAFFVSSTQIGIYEAAWTMASTLAIVSTSIAKTLFPSLSDMSTDDRFEEVSDLLNEGLTFAGIFTIPGLAGALAIGSRVLEIYGPEYGQGAMILVLLVLARLTSAYNGLFKNTINAIDRPDLGFRINAILLMSNVILNFSLIPIFGWYGAAIGTSTSAAIALVVGYFWVGQAITINFPYHEIGYQILASVAMVLLVKGLSQTFGSGRIATVIIVFLAASFYLVVLLWLSNTVREKTFSIVMEYSTRFGT